MEHQELPIVIHGFEPVRDDLPNRGIEAAYRAAGASVGRVVIREPLGRGIISGSGISIARIVPGKDARGTRPAMSMLDSLSRLPRPRSIAEASALRDLRSLCRQAIDVLGPEAGILHGAHCRRIHG